MRFIEGISKKNSNIKFHDYPSGRNLVVPCGGIDRQTDRQKHMMKLTGTFSNFENAPKNV